MIKTSLFKPVKQFKRVTDISSDYLLSIGVKGVALDADNTLAEHHSQIPIDGVAEWIKYIKNSGIKMIMVSNAKAPRVAPFAKRLGLDFVCLAAKPLPLGFMKAKKVMGIKSYELAVIGDQLFTDMMGANLCGGKGLLVAPIKEEQGRSFKIRRYFEHKLIRRYGSETK